MNILITAPSLNPQQNVSGISSVVMSIISHSKENYFHYLLGREDGESSRIKTTYNLLKQLVLFPYFVLINRIDIIHDNLPFNTKGILRESLIVFWSRLLCKPILVHVHGGEFLMEKCKSPIINFFINYIFRSAKIVVVLSDVEQIAIHNLYGINATVLYNAVDTKYFCPIENKQWNTKKTLLFIGRLHESKGLEDLTEAFKILYTQTSFRFILCGEGELKESLKKSLYSIMGSDFDFKGIVSGDLKKEVFQEADFFILPSRYGEGLPIALLEAMSSGLISIVTDDASMKYIIKDQINGVFVLKRNPLDISNKVQKLINSTQNELLVLSKNARNTILETFDINIFSLNLEKLYKSIAK
jgi:glycosyltransferase involved in cell wall biosynthesis